MPKYHDLTNKRFGRLVAVSLEPAKAGRTMWKCVCDCGNETTTNSERLKKGHTRSCGCLHREFTSDLGKARKKHGQAGTPEYQAWWAMCSRCYDEDNPSYKDYGARGIVVWHSWIKSFLAFYQEVGPRPSREHSLDRIDNDGPYAPGNCRWATAEEQANNRRTNIRYDFEGKSLTLTELAKATGICKSTLWARLRGRGLVLEEAIADRIVPKD